MKGKGGREGKGDFLQKVPSFPSRNFCKVAVKLLCPAKLPPSPPSHGQHHKIAFWPQAAGLCRDAGEPEKNTVRCMSSSGDHRTGCALAGSRFLSSSRQEFLKGKGGRGGKGGTFCKKSPLSPRRHMALPCAAVVQAWVPGLHPVPIQGKG